MDKQCIYILLALSLGTLVQGSVILLPSIDNPCQNDPTSTGPRQYRPISTQIELTITASNVANTTCQVLKNALSAFLSRTEISFLESSSPNITNFQLGINETTLSSANVFTRTLRHAALNVTILYNIMEEMVLNGTVQRFDQQMRNVMSAMLAVKCRVTITNEVALSNFTTEELELENELLLAEYDVFVDSEETMRQQPMPSNEKDFIHSGYTIAHFMQLYMAVLNGVLEAAQ